MSDQSKPSPLLQLAMLVVIVGGAYYGWKYLTASGMSDIERQVAEDAVKQYEIMKRQGSPIERCSYAGMVVAAYVQAKDEGNVARWKTIEAEDCRKAGVPR